MLASFITASSILAQVEGSVVVVYNMGLLDVPITQTFRRVNDGKYHVIRFTRSLANCTLQVDELQKQDYDSTGNCDVMLVNKGPVITAIETGLRNVFYFKVIVLCCLVKVRNRFVVVLYWLGGGMKSVLSVCIN